MSEDVLWPGWPVNHRATLCDAPLQGWWVLHRTGVARSSANPCSAAAVLCEAPVSLTRTRMSSAVRIHWCAGWRHLLWQRGEFLVVVVVVAAAAAAAAACRPAGQVHERHRAVARVCPPFRSHKHTDSGMSKYYRLIVGVEGASTMSTVKVNRVSATNHCAGILVHMSISILFYFNLCYNHYSSPCK